MKSLATNLAYVNVHSHMGIEPGPKVPDDLYRFNEGVNNNNRFNGCFFKLLAGANN